MAIASLSKKKKKPVVPDRRTVATPGKPQATFKPPTPAAPAKPTVTPVARPQQPNPVPKPTNLAPPVSTSGAKIRSTAESTYQNALRTGRQSIVNAALRLGSPEILNALKADPNFAEYVAVLDRGRADPTSDFAQSQYNEGKGLEDVDQGANAQNTYFSGKRMEDRQDLSKGYNDQRSGFLREYQQGFNELTGGMGDARSAYEGALGDADEADRGAFFAMPPTPTGGDPMAQIQGADPGVVLGNFPGALNAGRTPVVGQDINANGSPIKGTTTTKPKPGFQFVQTTGTRAGLSYNLVNSKDGKKKVRVYENGDRVAVG
jgi:hypothetical protein